MDNMKNYMRTGIIIMMVIFSLIWSTKGLSIGIDFLIMCFTAITATSVYFIHKSYELTRYKSENDINRENDKELFSQSILLLERSYNYLMSDRNDGEMPIPEQRNWLAAANSIENYKRIKDMLKTEQYITICSDHEDFWRRKFSHALDHHAIRSSAGYYILEGEDKRVYMSSALIIVNFSKESKERMWF